MFETEKTSSNRDKTSSLEEDAGWTAGLVLEGGAEDLGPALSCASNDTKAPKKVIL